MKARQTETLTPEQQENSWTQRKIDKRTGIRTKRGRQANEQEKGHTDSRDTNTASPDAKKKPHTLGHLEKKNGQKRGPKTQVQSFCTQPKYSQTDSLSVCRRTKHSQNVTDH